MNQLDFPFGGAYPRRCVTGTSRTIGTGEVFILILLIRYCVWKGMAGPVAVARRAFPNSKEGRGEVIQQGLSRYVSDSKGQKERGRDSSYYP